MSIYPGSVFLCVPSAGVCNESPYLEPLDGDTGVGEWQDAPLLSTGRACIQGSSMMKSISQKKPTCIAG